MHVIYFSLLVSNARISACFCTFCSTPATEIGGQHDRPSIHVFRMKHAVSVEYVTNVLRNLYPWAAFVKGTCVIFSNRHIHHLLPCSFLLVCGFIYLIILAVEFKRMLFRAQKLLLWYWNMSAVISQDVYVLCCGKMACLSKWVCNDKKQGRGKKIEQHKLNLPLRCLFHLKVAFYPLPCFPCRCESYVQGSHSLERLREHAGPEDREGAHCCKVPPCRFISPF